MKSLVRLEETCRGRFVSPCRKSAREVQLPPENRAGINEMMAYAHLSVTGFYSNEFELKYKRRNFATPKNYLDKLHQT
eukprot:6003583-Amphidinium_carterae.1